MSEQENEFKVNITQWKSASLLHNCYFTEHHRTSLTEWRHTAADDGPETSLVAAHTDREIPHTGRVAPHVIEGGGSEVTAPVEGDTQPTEGGQDLVAEALAALEAGVAIPPDTVDRANSLRLSEDLLKCHL